MKQKIIQGFTIILIVFLISILVNIYLRTSVLVVVKHEHVVKPDLHNRYSLSGEFESVKDNATHEKKRYKYGNKNLNLDNTTKQLENYLTALINFDKTSRIGSICEIGLIAGYSTTLTLLTTSSDSYTAFNNQRIDDKEQLEWLKNIFKERKINIFKGESMETLPLLNGTCDVIHILGTHPALQTDIMANIVSKDNLLLIDNCTRLGVRNLMTYNKELYLKEVVETYRVNNEPKKSLCVGHYNTSLKYSTPERSFILLNKSFCLPSWHGNKCQQYKPKQCTQFSDECFYSKTTGVLRVSCERWQDTHKNVRVIRDDLTVDNHDYTKSFNYYQSLQDHLGDVIELGSGPSTQSQHIMKNRKVSSITLVDPYAFQYMARQEHSPYNSETFGNIRTTIVNMPLEMFEITDRFDTLIMINAFNHIYDALSVITKSIQFIKDGGIFIWHEHLWDNYTGTANSKKDREFRLYPIRMKSIVAKQIIKIFDSLFLSWKSGESGQLDLYFIGKKRKTKSISEIPKHLPCFDNGKGKQVIVFFISRFNESYVLNKIDMVNSNSNVKIIILILTNTVSARAKIIISSFKNVKILISQEHMSDWRKQLGHYAEPCFSITPVLTEDILGSTDTICVGSSLVTIVLIGHSPAHLPNYDVIISRYKQIEFVDQIIIVWNNKDVAFQTTSNATVTLIQNENNSVNNRFNVTALIRTDAVLMIDDDVMISEPLLTKILLEWSLNTVRLVGVDRGFVNVNNEFRYRGKNPTFILGKTMLFHRKYLVEYMKDDTLVKWNSDKLCEDISMNGLIFNATHIPPFFVSMTSHYSRRELPETKRVSPQEEIRNSIAKRSDCVKWVSDHFQINFFKEI